MHEMQHATRVHTTRKKRFATYHLEIKIADEAALFVIYIEEEVNAHGLLLQKGVHPAMK